MLIKSIDIKDHPVLGDLHLDFTNEGGEPFSTIVLAGGNGTGKTVILETIHKLFEWNFPNDVGAIICEVILDKNNIKTLKAIIDLAPQGAIQPLLTISYKKDHPAQNNIKDYHFDIRITSPASFPIQLRPEDFDYRLVQGANQRKVFRSLYTEANVSFAAGNIKSVTTLIIDDLNQIGTRSGPNLAEQIAQLLVDVRAADAEDVMGRGKYGSRPADRCNREEDGAFY